MRSLLLMLLLVVVVKSDTDQKALDALLAASEQLSSSVGFERALNKIKIISGGEGKCTAEFTVEPEHLNTLGSLHGGMTATIVDVISTVAYMTHERATRRGVSVDIHVTYYRPAREGDEIVITGNTLKTGKNLVFLEAELRNKQSGALIAKGSHTKFVA